MKSVIEIYKKSMNSRLAEAKLNIKSSPILTAEKYGYLALKHSICKCKNNE